MSSESKPSPTNQYLAKHIDLLRKSLRYYTGRDLIDSEVKGVDAARTIFYAPFVVLSHDTAEDPIFTYANRIALEIFEMSWEEFKARGVYKFILSRPHIAFQDQIEQGLPFATPSGKIEIFSTKLSSVPDWTKTQFGYEIPYIPKWIEPWESLNHEKAKKYPFHVITPHPRWRTHSIFNNCAWLRETYEQEVTINASDAKKLGIKTGDTVDVWNDRSLRAHRKLGVRLVETITYLCLCGFRIHVARTPAGRTFGVSPPGSKREFISRAVAVRRQGGQRACRNRKTGSIPV